MSGAIKFTGDDWDFSVTLKQNGQPLDVSGATDIKIQVVDTNGRTPDILIPYVEANSGDAGADWSNGIVTFSFAAADTGSITNGNAWLEIQKNEDSKKTTWPRSNFVIEIGTLA
jgi:hypothetical protein